MPFHKIEFLIVLQDPLLFKERYQCQRNVFGIGSKFFQKTSFFEFFFFGFSFSHMGFYWFLSFFEVRAKVFDMPFVATFKTGPFLALLLHLVFCDDSMASGSLLPIVGVGPISTCIHCIGVWGRHLDS